MALPTPGTYGMLVAKHSGKAIEVEDASLADGTRLIQSDRAGTANQLFRFSEAAPGFVSIAALHSDKFLQVADGLEPVRQFARTAEGSQEFSVAQSGDFLVIANRLSGRVLDVRGASKDNGAELIQFPFLDDHDNQLWSFVPVDVSPCAGITRQIRKNDERIANDLTGLDDPDITPEQRKSLQKDLDDARARKRGLEKELSRCLAGLPVPG